MVLSQEIFCLSHFNLNLVLFRDSLSFVYTILRRLQKLKCLAQLEILCLLGLQPRGHSFIVSSDCFQYWIPHTVFWSNPISNDWSSFSFLSNFGTTMSTSATFSFNWFGLPSLPFFERNSYELPMPGAWNFLELEDSFLWLELHWNDNKFSELISEGAVRDSNIFGFLGEHRRLPTTDLLLQGVMRCDGLLGDLWNHIWIAGDCVPSTLPPYLIPYILPSHHRATL